MPRVKIISTSFVSSSSRLTFSDSSNHSQYTSIGSVRRFAFVLKEVVQTLQRRKEICSRLML